MSPGAAATRPERPRNRSTLRSVGLAAVGSLVGGAALLSGTAHAALQKVPENGVPGHLVLWSDHRTAQLVDLSPGVVRYWQVTATIEGASDASLVLEIRKDGDLVDHPDGLVVTVERCDVAWRNVPADPRCPTGYDHVIEARPDHDYSTSSPVFDLRGVDPVDGTHLLVGLSLDEADPGDESLMGLSGGIGLGLTAAADDVGGSETPGDPTVPPAGSPARPAVPVDSSDLLPVTGADTLGLVLLAVGTVGLGVVALATRGRGGLGVRLARSEGATQSARPRSARKSE